MRINNEKKQLKLYTENKHLKLYTDKKVFSLLLNYTYQKITYWNSDYDNIWDWNIFYGFSVEIFDDVIT